MYLVLMVVGAHLGMATVDLPGLWRRPEVRREFWSVVILLLVGLALAIMLARGFVPLSAFKVLERIFKPIGSVLFTPKEQ